MSELTAVLSEINDTFAQVEGITAPVMSETMKVGDYLAAVDLLASQVTQKVNASIKDLLEVPKELFDVSIHVEMLRGMQESLLELRAEIHTALDHLDPNLTLLSAWSILTESESPLGEPGEGNPGVPPVSHLPHRIDYTPGVIPTGFDMAPASQAGVAAGFPLYAPTAEEKLYQSPTLDPAQWTAASASGDYIELLTLDRAVSFLGTVSKNKFDELAPYFLAKAIRDSGVSSLNLADSFVLSKKLAGGLATTLDGIDAWGDSISNLVNVYTFYKNTGKLPDASVAVGLDDWAHVLKQNSSAFLANILSGATLGLLTASEAQLLTDTSIQGWELIINGAIDFAAAKMGVGIATTQSFRYGIFTNENPDSGHNGVHMAGGGSTDLLVGGTGDDVIHGGAGNDLLVGNMGRDTALFNGSRADTSITPQADGTLSVSGNEGVDILAGIERLQFADGNKVAFDLDGNAGLVVRGLAALLGPKQWYNKAMFSSSLAQLDNQSQTVDSLMRTGLQTMLGPAPTNVAVVNLLFHNLAGRTPNAGELNQFTQLLDRGIYTQSGLAVFAAGHDLNVQNIDLVGLAATGIDYV